MPAQQPAPIVLLTGPPGGGKSTVGHLVAAAFDRSVHIDADVVRESIVGGFVPPTPEMFGPAGVAQFALQREIVIEWARRKAEHGYLVVVDDAPIPPDGHFERQYAPLLEIDTTVPVVVRADGDVVRERIRRRSGPFDEELVGVVDRALVILDALEHPGWHTIDSTELDADQTADAIVEHIRGHA